ncbi:GAF domain-containing protein [Rhodocyclus tenuis]|uniref:GAF domain-containing protein n=1 Tax=Rhodocyclus gracilis TaxID=2929842 RepID=UPI0012989E4A|nr:GAF domain-containing protein [Rhodocyclus gracilis]MRD73036.1 GAF domain-containing protein [Rhodocyclus gracilis]
MDTSFTPPATADKREFYALLAEQTRALLQGERDWLANLSQFSALVYGALGEVNWAGFYMVRGQELVLGPFQGKVACVRIPFARGVCGACAREQTVQIVPDVHAFPGHIACDADSRSELVLPVRVRGQLCAVFDIDSPRPGRFDAEDAVGLAAMLTVLIDATEWP